MPAAKPGQARPGCEAGRQAALKSADFWELFLWARKNCAAAHEPVPTGTQTVATAGGQFELLIVSTAYGRHSGAVFIGEIGGV